MELETCIRERRSVRRFTEEPVDHATIEKIIELARFAPSWKNTQTSRYYVIEDADKIARICEEGVMGFEGNQKTLAKAKQLLVLATVNKRCGYERDGSFTTSKEDRWEMFDAGIAAQTFSLAAHSLGVGSVMMGIFDEKKIAEIIGLPEGQSVSCLLAFGYPKFMPDPVPRKEVSDLLTYVEPAAE